MTEECSGPAARWLLLHGCTVNSSLRGVLQQAAPRSEAVVDMLLDSAEAGHCCLTVPPC